MILYASQRANAKELAKHLLNTIDNDHVTVHDIRGFLADDLIGALREAEAMSKGTRCRQFLFSVSLNPPEDADVPIEDFEAAIEDIERKMALLHQPRIIVFHEKKGRRHCHVIWSRIDTEKLTAIRMSHFKMKLMEVSRFLFLRHGWKLPKGMTRVQHADGTITAQGRSPLHMSREEYRQAVRFTEEPDVLKKVLKGAWEQSDSKETFVRALEERGFLLAQGERRGFVVLHVKGGVYSLTRWMDLGTRELKSRIGAPDTLPTIEKAQGFIASRMAENLQHYIAESKQQAKEKRQPLVRQVRALALKQRKERQLLIDHQQKRWVEETKIRAARIPRGVRGIWHKVSGVYKQIRVQNEAETKSCLIRDRKELHALVRAHIIARQELQKTVNAYKEEHKAEDLRIRHEIARYVKTATAPQLLPVIRQDKPLIVEQMAQIERKISLFSSDLLSLQSALENSALSDDVRARIRIMVERALETLHIKSMEEKEQKQRSKLKEAEASEKQRQLSEYIRRYTELQVRHEQEIKKAQDNKIFYATIMNMSYALNGIPRWKITVMLPPPEKNLDENTFTKTLKTMDRKELLNTLFKAYHPRKPTPETAVSDLRASVLGVKELLRRAGIPPTGDSRTIAPVKVTITTGNVTTIKLDTQRRPQ